MANTHSDYGEMDRVPGLLLALVTLNNLLRTLSEKEEGRIALDTALPHAIDYYESL